MVRLKRVSRSQSNRPKRYLKSKILGTPSPRTLELIAELKPLETWRVLLQAECWNGVLIHRYSVVGRGESLSSATARAIKTLTKFGDPDWVARALEEAAAGDARCSRDDFNWGDMPPQRGRLRGVKDRRLQLGVEWRRAGMPWPSIYERLGMPKEKRRNAKLQGDLSETDRTRLGKAIRARISREDREIRAALERDQERFQRSLRAGLPKIRKEFPQFRIGRPYQYETRINMAPRRLPPFFPNG